MGLMLFMVVFYGGFAILGLKSGLTSQLRTCTLVCLTLPLLLAWEGYGRLIVFLSLALPASLHLIANRREKAEAMIRHRAEAEALRVAILKSEE